MTKTEDHKSNITLFLLESKPHHSLLTRYCVVTLFAVNFCPDTAVEKMRKVVVTHNQISEDSKSAMEN